MKKIWIILLVLFLFGISLGAGYYFATRETKPKIASTIILDINPSIKIDLDKDDNVLFVTPLNEDAKDLVTEDMVGKKVTETVNQISNNLVERRYGDGDLVILVSSKDKTKADLVKETLTESLKEKEVEARIVSYVIKEDVKNESDISDGKAALIEDIIGSNSDLTFEDLKDKSISDLLTYEENITEPVTEEPVNNEDDNTQTNTTTNTGTNTSTETNNKPPKTYTCTPPSNLKDTEWCDWNNKRPQNCEFYYDDISTDTVRGYALSRYGLSDSIGGYITTEAYSGASYCRAHVVQFTTSSEKITSYWDSHTGAFLKEKRIALPTFISKDEAKRIAKEYVHKKDANFDESEIDYMEVTTGTDRSGGPDEYYRHQVLIRMNDQTHYTVDVDAVTREVKYYRTWTN